jgi:citrate lyase synthetase
VEYRRHAFDGTPISASNVRRMLKMGDWDGIKDMVPEATYLYLKGLEK